MEQQIEEAEEEIKNNPSRAEDKALVYNYRKTNFSHGCTLSYQFGVI